MGRARLGIGRRVAAGAVGLAVVMLSACDGTPGTVERVTDGDGQSHYPAISADGRFVAFYSQASNLVPGDTNSTNDVFLWDREDGVTTRITDGNSDSQNPSLSADGRYLAFNSHASNLVPGDTNGFSDIFLWDRQTGATTRITDGNDESLHAVISANGRFVTFDSKAWNLVPADDDLADRDVFVWDAHTGETTRITHSVWYLDEDSFAGGISADGRYLAFSSYSSTLDPTDTNERSDAFLWDSVTGTVTRLTDGAAGAESISGDGRFVTYSAMWGGNSQVYVWDATTGTSVRLTDDFLDASGGSRISADGQSVTFRSGDPDLVPDDTNGVSDIFVWDRPSGEYARITDGDGDSNDPAISADGASITFWSAATNLVPEDTNTVPDIFLWDKDDEAQPG